MDIFLWTSVRWLLAVVIHSLMVHDSFQGVHEERLFKEIFTNRDYNPYVRPVINEEDSIEVKFGLTLQQIIDVDEKNEMLLTNLWLNYEWTDYKMAWNKSEYGGVQSIRVPFKKIWTPDILLYNSADEDIDSKFPTNLVVYSSGLINWIPPGLFISSCGIDIKWFPFDEQKCTMKFGSWTYDGTKLNLTMHRDDIDMQTYQESGEWKIVDVPAERNVFKYECCPEPYVDIKFHIIIRRRPLYYAFNLIIPCMLISSMTLLSFALPPDSGEKISLGVTILLSLSVFLLIVAQSVPSTSLALPLLGVYFACIMVLCTISVIVTTVVLNFHHRKPDQYVMPHWVQHGICEWLAWVLRMQRPGRDMSRKGIIRKNSIRELHDMKPPSRSLMANVIDQDDKEAFTNSYPMMGYRMDNNRVSYPKEELTLILKELRFLTNNVKDSTKNDDEIADWKFAAMVLDRLCAWIFTTVTLIATVAIFFAAPNLFE